jgi:endogenous inhibitor of DNA gyrase (YacG/DUF329 family)
MAGIKLVTDKGVTLASSAGEKKSVGSCPLCGKPTDASFRPFCSKRCADVDLHRWLSGVYSIPVAEQEDSCEPPTPDPDEEKDPR